MRKKRLALLETSARTSLPPTQTIAFCGRLASRAGMRWRALYARSPPMPKLRKRKRWLRGLCSSSLIQLKACPLPAVLLDPRQATTISAGLVSGDGQTGSGNGSELIIVSILSLSANFDDRLEGLEPLAVDGEIADYGAGQVFVAEELFGSEVRPRRMGHPSLCGWLRGVGWATRRDTDYFRRLSGCWRRA